MTRNNFRLWTNVAGIHDLQDEKYICTIRKKIIDDNNKLWSNIISIHAPCALVTIIQYFNSTYTKIEEKTPLALFVSYPQLFYELFWPYARERLGRQYYILRFDSPLMVKAKFEYELSVLPDDRLEQPMIYLGCLSDRVPILTASINSERQSIIPYEVLVTTIKAVLEKCKDWAIIKNELKIEENEFELLIRHVLILSKPQFIEFCMEKYISEKIVIVSMAGEGSLLEYKKLEIEGKKREIWSKIKKSISFTFISKGIINILRSLLCVSLREPRVHLEIYPKSSSSTLWTYIYAPQKYHIRECSVSFRCKDNILENNSPNNPDLLSYCLRKKETIQSLRPIDVHFSIQIPRTDYFWLNTIDKILLLFSIIWLLACLKFLPLSFKFSKIAELAFSFVKYPGILDSTFVLIGFILLARSWFFHESTIYKVASIRFAVLLIILILLCLLFVFLRIIYNC
jgi:hypothetical protein